MTGVPFAIEGDDEAARVARRIVRALGGVSFSLPAKRKAAYHAWATMTSPLLLAFLVTLEEAARAAGLTRQDARRKSLPIIRQTLANYSRLGPAHSFSGPLVRGDAETVAKHLAALKKHPGAREVYVALARAALRGLPVKNQDELKRLLRDSDLPRPSASELAQLISSRLSAELWTSAVSLKGMHETVSNAGSGDC